MFSFRHIFQSWQDVEVTGPPLSHLNSLPQPRRAPRAAGAAAQHPFSTESSPGDVLGPTARRQAGSEAQIWY